ERCRDFLRSPGSTGQSDPARDRSPGRSALHRPAAAGHPRPHQETDPEGRVGEDHRPPRLRALTRALSGSSVMRVLFYGTPEFALPTLDALLAHHLVVAVVTQPDRPAGRGRRSVAPPVKRRAEAAGLPVVQPNRLRDPEWPE